MATRKVNPIGVCDFCGEPFPAEVSPYTTKGKPRLYCSLECRQTANSRNGAPIRARKMRRHVERDEWENPSPFVREDATEADREAARRAIGNGVSRSRKAEVRAGTWRNPALDDAAREKLSRPRVHGDDPVLHSAMEKLKAGLTMTDLTDEEADTYREYRQRLRDEHRDELNAAARRRYRRARQQAEEE